MAKTTKRPTRQDATDISRAADAFRKAFSAPIPDAPVRTRREALSRLTRTWATVTEAAKRLGEAAGAVKFR